MIYFNSDLVSNSFYCGNVGDDQLKESHYLNVNCGELLLGMVYLSLGNSKGIQYLEQSVQHGDLLSHVLLKRLDLEVPSIPPFETSSAPWKIEYQEALSLFHAGKYEESLDFCIAMLEKYPEKERGPDVLFAVDLRRDPFELLKGYCLLMTQEYEGASQIFEKTLGGYPASDLETAYALALVYHLMGEFENKNTVLSEDPFDQLYGQLLSQIL